MTLAAAGSSQAQLGVSKRRLPMDVSTPGLEAALAGYGANSMAGAVPATSGSGASHEGTGSTLSGFVTSPGRAL